MVKVYKVFIASLFFLASSHLAAQDVSFRASAPSEVSLGEQFRVVYEINDRVKDFTPPDFADFIFLSRQQGISTVNWKTTQQYIYYFKATKEGTFTVAPATAKHDGDLIESNSLEITVTKSAQSSQSSQTQNSNQSTSTPSAQAASGDNLFVRLILDKKSVFVGEQITGYIKVYTKVQLSNIEQNFQGPDYRGFYVQNVKIPPLSSLEPEKVGEETFYSGLIRKMILIPQKTGKISIDAFDIIVQQDKPVKVGYFTTYQTQNVTLTTKPVTIDVKALPANKPAGFKGAIGDLDIKASLSETEIQTNDAVVFRVSVSGNGNIKLIDNINYSLPPTFEVFDPVVKTKLSENGLSGTKTFEITAIPRHAGEIEVKPFELVYFNPNTGSFVTKRTQAFKLNVAKSAGDSSRVVVSNLSREDVELLQSDIRYIVTKTDFVKAKTYLIESIWYYMLWIVFTILFIAFIILRRGQIKRNANLAKTRHKRASKMANKRFKVARKLIADDNKEAFYEELSRAIWGYISDKLSLPQSELSTDQARDRLVSKNVDEELANELLELIQFCEFARYAPGSVDQQPKELLEKANKIISKIEQNI